MVATQNEIPAAPEIDFSTFGPVERKPVSRIQKFVASFLHRNWVTIPHVTHHDEADVTDLEERRRALFSKDQVKITPVPLIVKAIALALREFPQFNVSLDAKSGDILQKQYVHIGVAVDTPKGLLVPVVPNCDSKSVLEISAEIQSLSEKARTKGLSNQEMSGGCITLTSLGHIGGTGFTPIVNAPEVAILGVCRARQQPFRGEGGGIIWRQMLPLSLSYDHRVINGADAARFCRFIAQTLSSPALFD
ncbi:2-oxo acid dehydrogenase subunit E2 [Sphingobium tyrosinilyticum]|uniref:2-oxo acid dehydrogenase subunit E2 n=1 Tax=Sphingobium tyrosinilyticum TaxID=2715436 RepID=A0ABV9F609_9SPHN